MSTKRLCLLALAVLLLGTGGCRHAEAPNVSMGEWRTVLGQALHNNPPGNVHFAEGVWRWSGKLFQQAAVSKRGGAHREEDRKALIEWAVLAYYVRAYDLAFDSPSAFVQDDQEMMSTAMRHAVETFGKPTMKEAWNSFAAAGPDFGLKPVQGPFQ